MPPADVEVGTSGNGAVCWHAQDTFVATDAVRATAYVRAVTGLEPTATFPQSSPSEAPPATWTSAWTVRRPSPS